MDDLARQRVLNQAPQVLDGIHGAIDKAMSDLGGKPDAERVAKIFDSEMAKIGVPSDIDIYEPNFIIGIVLGRVLARGATREQVMAFYQNVVDESGEVNARPLLPGVSLDEQQRWVRLLTASLWEICYALEKSHPNADTEERWAIVVRAGAFILEFQMLASRMK